MNQVFKLFVQAGLNNCIWADCFAIGVVARWIKRYDGEDDDDDQYHDDDQYDQRLCRELDFTCLIIQNDVGGNKVDYLKVS